MNCKKSITILCLIIATITYTTGQNLKLMTYNMRLDISVDGHNAWQYRKDLFTQQLLDHAPDFIGTQEGLPHQIDFIDEKLEQHAYIGIGRDGGKGKGEYCAVFYNTENFELQQSNTFWLSRTPKLPSKGWDAAYIRICTYGLFVEKTSGRIFWVFNTHLDNSGEKARRKGIRLINKKIKQVNHAKHPVILMGDLNAEPHIKFIKRLSKKFIDSKVAEQNTAGNMDGTYNAFKLDEPAERRIDYIFLDKTNFEIIKYSVPKETRNGKYISDHFPVIAEVTFL